MAKKLIVLFFIFMIFTLKIVSEISEQQGAPNSNTSIEKNVKEKNYSEKYQQPKQGWGTPFEAKNMVNKAVEFHHTQGRDKAFLEFMKKDSKFFYKDLYVFVIDMQGNILIHGGEKNLVGTNQLNLKDSFGKHFIKEFVEMMKTKDSGWIEYNWRNYETYKIEQKLTYLKKIDDDCFIGCGAYYNK